MVIRAGWGASRARYRITLLPAHGIKEARFAHLVPGVRHRCAKVIHLPPVFVLVRDGLAGQNNGHANFRLLFSGAGVPIIVTMEGVGSPPFTTLAVNTDVQPCPP